MKEARITPRENARRVFLHQEPYWIPVIRDDIMSVVPSGVKDRYLGTVENPNGFDDFGVEYTFCPDINAPMPLETDPVLTDMEDWREKVRFPDLDRIDWAACAERDLQKVDRNNQFLIVNLIRNQFERLHSLMGFQEALMALLTDEDEVAEYLEAFTAWRLKFIDKVAEYYHPDAMMFNDDYASANGMLMSPPYWRRHFKPGVKKLMDRVHEHGMFGIVHCCGLMREIFPDFVEIGVDGIQCQSLNDLPALKKQFPKKMVFLGGMNNVGILDSPHTTEEEALAEIRRTLRELGTGGDYVMIQNFFTPKITAMVLRELEEMNRQGKEKHRITL